MNRHCKYELNIVISFLKLFREIQKLILNLPKLFRDLQNIIRNLMKLFRKTLNISRAPPAGIITLNIFHIRHNNKEFLLFKL